MGTGGTISGVGRYLKEQNPDVQVIGADPAGSVYSGGTGRPYLVEGVGEDFWPETYDRGVADRVIEVSDADSFAFTRRLAREEAMLVGGSSGMAAFAARQVAHELAAEGRTDAVIVVLLPDSGRGYLTKVFNDDWLAQYGFATGAQADHRTVGEVLRGKSGQLPDLVHTHPGETIAEAVHILQEYGVSQMPVVRAEPPIVAAEVAGSVSERTLLDALFTGTAKLTDQVEDHMSAGAADDRLDRAGRRRRHAAGEGRRRAGPRGRQAHRRADPAGPPHLRGGVVRRLTARPPRAGRPRLPRCPRRVRRRRRQRQHRPGRGRGRQGLRRGTASPSTTAGRLNGIERSVSMEEVITPEVKGTITNTSDEERAAIFEMVFSADGEPLATLSCSAAHA